MNPKTLSVPLLTVFFFVTSPAVLSEDNLSKREAKTEERMKDEKKRDEQSARDYGTRVKVARFDSVWRAPKTEDIDVIQMHETLAKAHKAISFLTYDCAAKEEAEAVAGFIAKAKDLGADGVVMIGFADEIQARTIFSPDDRRLFRANAIIYQPAK